MNLPDPILVSDQVALVRCVNACQNVSAIAVDTEFMRTDTFYPILGLIQICDGDTVWLIDPLTIDDFSSLESLFHDAAITKVFHSCSEDLEVLRHQLGLIPTPLFDTQVAAAFLGLGFSRGYSALIKEVLDVQLEKHETRSDWLKRPLSLSQLNYAAEDVFFLLKAYKWIEATLQQKQRLAWVEQDMENLVADARLPEDIDDYYLRVKGAWRLSSSQIFQLQAVTRWREDEARKRNRPRNRVISDKLLLDIISRCPADLTQLKQISGIHMGQVKRFGEKILSLLNAAQGEGKDLVIPPEPLSRDQRNQLSELRRIVEKSAENLGVAPEVLARKKDLEYLVMHGQLPDTVNKSWRFDIIGNSFMNYYREKVST